MVGGDYKWSKKYQGDISMPEKNKKNHLTVNSGVELSRTKFMDNPKQFE